MKTLASLDNGALVVTEQGGNVTFTFNEALSLGGGAAAGILSLKGAGSMVIQGKLGLDLAAKLIEAHSPSALVPIEAAASAIVDGVVSGL